MLRLVALWVSCNTVLSFITQPLSPLSRGQQVKFLPPTGICYATKEKKQKNKELEFVNGTPKVDAKHTSSHSSSSSSSSSTTKDSGDYAIADVLNDINRQISDGSTELMANITNVMDEKILLQGFSDSSAMELSEYISNLAAEIQIAQQRELEKQLAAIEAQFTRPLEQLAFSDVPLYEKDSKKTTTGGNTTVDEDAQRRKLLQQELVWAGANSTLPKTSSMKTKDIFRNFNVAPLYYSIALLIRWAKKASYPSILLLQAYKGVASMIKSKGGDRRWKLLSKRKSRNRNSNSDQSYEDFIKDAEAMQSGWKRTGAIAAKGSLAKKWAILRRSAEVWAYFSSFYLKDRRILRRYESGRWSEERFKEERSKLGAEITQNLLRLGPTFIKVSIVALLVLEPVSHPAVYSL